MVLHERRKDFDDAAVRQAGIVLGPASAARRNQYSARTRRRRRALRQLPHQRRGRSAGNGAAMIETRRVAESVKSASPEETRERILTAAREVIAKKGKRGATTREIADVAGVNEATIFRHFGTKEALIVAVAQHFCGLVALRGVATNLGGDLAGDLLAIARTMYERMESQMDMIRWSLVEQDYEADIFAA